MAFLIVSMTTTYSALVVEKRNYRLKLDFQEMQFQAGVKKYDVVNFRKSLSSAKSEST